MAKTSKLGLVCLIIAIVLMAFFNLTILTILGFLYYAYKLLYKKEEPTRRDNILITVLFILLLLIYIGLLTIYLYGNSYL